VGLLGLARVAIQSGQWEDAGRACDRALALAPGRADAWVLKAQAVANAKEAGDIGCIDRYEWETARWLPYIEQAVQLAPERADLLALVARHSRDAVRLRSVAERDPALARVASENICSRARYADDQGRFGKVGLYREWAAMPGQNARGIAAELCSWAFNLEFKAKTFGSHGHFVVAESSVLDGAATISPFNPAQATALITSAKFPGRSDRVFDDRPDVVYDVDPRRALMDALRSIFSTNVMWIPYFGRGNPRADSSNDCRVK
jgi:hypothetical protein